MLVKPLLCAFPGAGNQSLPQAGCGGARAGEGPTGSQGDPAVTGAEAVTCEPRSEG